MGKIVKVWHSVKVSGHVEEVLEELAKLAKSSS
jgi:peroxiredoxin